MSARTPTRLIEAIYASCASRTGPAGFSFGETSAKAGSVDQKIGDLKYGSSSTQAWLESLGFLGSDIELQGGSLNQELGRTHCCGADTRLPGLTSQAAESQTTGHSLHRDVQGVGRFTRKKPNAIDIIAIIHFRHHDAT